MEGVIQGTDDVLVPGLQFTAPDGASYLTDRIQATYHPQGAGAYSSTGVGGTSTMRFQISDPGQGFLDLSTLRLAGSINATGAQPLRLPCASIMSCFSRLRVLISGTVVEDVQFSGRLAEMFSRLRPANRNWSDSIQGLGKSELEAVVATPAIPNPAAAGTTYAFSQASTGFLNGWRNEDIPNGQSRKFVSVIGPLGLTQTHYWLNVGRHPLTLELTLASGADCAITTDPVATSTDFTLTDCRIICDIVHVNAVVLEKYNQLLEQSKSGLPLHLSSYSTTLHVLPLGTDLAITLQRAFNRLKTVFATFTNDRYARPAGANLNGNFCEYNSFVSWHGSGGPGSTLPFGSPVPYNPNNDSARVQLTIGPMNFPSFPAQSLAELYLQLQKALAMDGLSGAEGLSFPPQEWRRSSMILAWNLEAASGTPGSGFAAYTGISLRDTGESVRLTLSGVPGNATEDSNSRLQRGYVTLHHDLIVMLTKEGALVLS